MIRARKRFGQHFLEPVWVDKLITAIDPQPNETFIEIGPGRGALTIPLARRARSVVAYEIDRDLARELRDTVPPNVTIVEGDFLETFEHPTRATPAIPGTSYPAASAQSPTSSFQHQAPGTPYPAPSTKPPAPGEAHPARGDARVRVAANLPYNVASPILFKLAALYRDGLPLRDATVMLQREVADRLLATPGTKEYGVLTVLIRHGASIERVMNLPPGAFRPPPDVRSSVVRLRFHTPAPPVRDRSVFVALVQAVFTRRRKTIANALLAFDRRSGLAPAAALARAGLDGRRRPETLSIAELARLSDVFSAV
jgi:16S rRNA (adenine1518-N6/adenine1519-N6)-dimethyltransferase